MEILRFTLSGRQAFFKKPEVNAYFYFTYGHIHKVALYGLFGAILGYGGYIAQTEGKKPSEVPAFPEFYERLKDVKVSVIPVCDKGNFERKMVVFNNSVGYASEEQGGNLIIKQQWLEDPRWNIYVKVDSEEAQAISDAIMGHKCIYMPYLGTNDHPADIENVSVLEVESIKDPQRIDSFFIKGQAEVDLDDDEQERPYRYEEMLPCGLEPELNQYMYERYVLTNLTVKKAECEVFTMTDVDDRQYYITFI